MLIILRVPADSLLRQFVGLSVHDMAHPDAPILEIVLVTLDSKSVDVDSGRLQDANNHGLVFLFESLLKDKLLESEVKVDEAR